MAQAMQRSPFFALMGPKRDVYPGEIVRGLRTFYRSVLVERDGLRAMAKMNSVISQDEETFRIDNCEQLFRDVWSWYLEGTSTEEHISARLEEIVRKEQAERPRSEAEIKHLRAYMREYILDYHARFEESRRHFFMIDLHPQNQQRFNLVLTPVTEGAETLQIAETSHLQGGVSVLRR